MPLFTKKKGISKSALLTPNESDSSLPHTWTNTAVLLMTPQYIWRLNDYKLIYLAVNTHLFIFSYYAYNYVDAAPNEPVNDFL